MLEEGFEAEAIAGGEGGLGEGRRREGEEREVRRELSGRAPIAQSSGAVARISASSMPPAQAIRQPRPFSV